MCRRLCRLFLCVAVLLSVAIGISMQVGAATARTEAEACEVPSAVYSTIEAALADPLCPDITLAQGRFLSRKPGYRKVRVNHWRGSGGKYH